MRAWMLAPVALAAAGLVAAVGEGRPVPGAPKCTIFPRSSHWNRPVDRLPVHPRSDAIVAAVGRSRGAHADFGSGLYERGPIGIPFKVVSGRQRRVPVSFEYSSESDRGPYPLPRDVPIEGGAARTAIVT